MTDALNPVKFKPGDLVRVTRLLCGDRSEYGKQGERRDDVGWVLSCGSIDPAFISVQLVLIPRLGKPVYLHNGRLEKVDE
jgi:hypothetical protein